ncbi:MAG: ABC-F family ATP-binding cassette domain-containing protein [Pseudomonadota bacterium]|nr:ABC-F family ATP-binding cassette domain-containing protein [Pseudomonadota bacterium]
MELLRARGIEKVYADRPILRGVDLSIGSGERIGLVGVNGCGKSTLLRILGGAVSPDHGDVFARGTIALLDQDPVLPGETVGDAADDAIKWHAELLAAWEEALTNGEQERADELQAKLDDRGWDVSHTVEAMLSRVGAPPREARCDRLSGGERRRVALARCLLGAPDLLLLDEPTNHLDADTVEWLQVWLAAQRGAVVIVTHDRYLLEAVATRIIEVEDGVGVSYDGSYADYLIERAERRSTMERADDQRLSMIAREAEWASRSPAARSVKQKARLERLAALQSQRGFKKDPGFALDLRTGLKHGGTVLEGHGVWKSYGGRTLLKNVDFGLVAGDRIGILGPNGVGKTTLLRLIMGQDKPDKGTLVRGARVKASVLDQERTGLDLDQTVFEAAGGGNDQVKVGEGFVHVASFLGRFLFTREFFTRQVRALSGGERARLLLAKLLLQGSNLLLLDEPTNDLDLQTMRVLEEALMGYDGVAIIVTHDRAFLDRVCTGVLAFEGEGNVVRYASRQQYLSAQAAKLEAARAEAKAEARGEAKAEVKRAEPVAEARPPAPPRRKLSFKEQKEFEELPVRIELLEAEQAKLSARLVDPGSWRDASTDASALSRRLAALPVEIDALMSRWSELGARA